MKLSVFTLLVLTAVSFGATATCQIETPVSAIQGETKQSPLLNKTVSTSGVVTAVLYPDSKAAGMLLQSLTPDNNPKTSEALLIADQALVQKVKPGQLLEVKGKVVELNGMTALVDVSSSVCGQQAAPQPVTAKVPVQSKQDWEALEGQYLSFPQQLVVNDTYGLSRYGEVLLADKRLWVATELYRPGKTANTFEQQQRLAELILDDGIFKQNPDPVIFPDGNLSAGNTVRVGDTVHNLQGYLIETKQGYRLVAAQVPDFKASNARAEAPKAKAADHIRVASFNVLNFFTGETATNPFPTRRGATDANELKRQQAKMIAALSRMDADIIGLLEVENNGFDKRSALATLVRELNKTLGEERYAFVKPEASQGNDAIKVAIIYNQQKVTEAGKAAVTAQGPFAYGSRPPLAQSFQAKNTSTTFTVSINHFKSKGSCPEPQSGIVDKANADHNDGQGCWNQSRVEAAKALTAWLQTQPTGVNTPHQLVIGDLNAYRQEDPIYTLEQAGWVHLAPTGDAGHYSYVYKGRTGSLDHALASKNMAKQLTQFQHWAINADEPAVLDYNTEFKSKAQQQSLYAPDPFRSSDHDPVLIDFKF
ncbi:ExeM/NucH family extracellular endonuclease [Rheinheimera mesophila]|uniref:ExeM/NucH family extracellular endonuclease n=1 Tax=Rheinheimera mesophila TaxID=1547515 RepID=A0A3P3QKS5_9GAMM|nr:ExeM/NucH family extracellular endonuclease [Rheinheimera mesophila]KKL02963.1 nuclease [Rheinheimera mesophila]RRJ21039.1 ExeM/NucH family extracellular endonuclease [Rheinheimera mesophila]